MPAIDCTFHIIIQLLLAVSQDCSGLEDKCFGEIVYCESSEARLLGLQVVEGRRMSRDSLLKPDARIVSIYPG